MSIFFQCESHLHTLEKWVKIEVYFHWEWWTVTANIQVNQIF